MQITKSRLIFDSCCLMETLRSARTVAEWLNGKALCQLLKSLKPNSLCNSNNNKDQQDNSKWWYQHYQKHVCKTDFSYCFSITASTLNFQATQDVEGSKTYWDAAHLTNHACLNINLGTPLFPPLFFLREISGTAGVSGWFWTFWGLPKHNPSLLLERSSPGHLLGGSPAEQLHTCCSPR